MQNQNQRSGGQGFQKIGSLIPPISNSPSTEATTSSKSSALRTVSGPTAPTKGLPAKTGTPDGTCGSSVTLTSTDPQVLAELTTGKLMRGIEALLPPQLDLRPMWRPGETAWEAPMAYRATGTAADKAETRKVIQGTMTTLPVKVICKELAKLNALTRRREGSMADTELLIASYAERLAPYPGEAVIWALRKWPEWSEAGKWWPAWAELHDMLEGRVAERRLMLEALG